uniref:C2H2-type domain-containing protein n=1 Tax=Gasterosteus aculeatus aculeatus TaxID=481459 RepID=A0AAQ4P0Z0_GASAC
MVQLAVDQIGRVPLSLEQVSMVQLTLDQVGRVPLSLEQVSMVQLTLDQVGRVPLAVDQRTRVPNGTFKPNMLPTFRITGLHTKSMHRRDETGPGTVDPMLTPLALVLSECIKIQPTDIQPDVFSYLLHIMYTGRCPKQPVDPSRLQDGMKFLHAYQLCRKHAEGAADSGVDDDMVRMSNLYGIQISSQLANKEAGGAPETTTAPSEGRGGGSHPQLALAAGLEGVPSATHNVCSVASGEDSNLTAQIKKERVEEEEEEEDGKQAPGGGSPDSSPMQDLLFKDRALVLLCPRCGERCSSPEDLRDHLFSHALDAGAQGGELDTGGEEGPTEDARWLEEALRQSQALANQLAAELRRSRGGRGGGG